MKKQEGGAGRMKLKWWHLFVGWIVVGIYGAIALGKGDLHFLRIYSKKCIRRFPTNASKMED